MEEEKDEDVARELGFRQRLIANELRLADRVLVPSSAQKAFLAQLLDDQGKRMQVLPPGRIRRLNPASAPSVSARPLRVGYWGSLAWWKGPHLLLQALHHLPDSSMVEAHFFGLPAEPDYGCQLEALATGLSVVFHGKFRPSDLQRQELHLAVFPSLCYESYSFVLDEAFQLGLPVIVPDRGSPATRVGSAGLTFKVGDELDLASKICSVLEEPVLLERLRQGQPAGPPLSLKAHVGQLEGIYAEVVADLEVSEPALEMAR
jgi:glycosyltransferase involved in cell wall biosynthesis